LLERGKKGVNLVRGAHGTESWFEFFQIKTLGGEGVGGGEEESLVLKRGNERLVKRNGKNL